MWISLKIVLFIYIAIADTSALALNFRAAVRPNDEGPCVIVPSVLANLDKNFINDLAPEGGFYLPFNSKLESVLIAQAILGRELTDDDDSSKYCPRLEWKNEENSNKSYGTFSGFEGNRTSLACENLDAQGDRRKCSITHKNGFGDGGNIFFSLTDQKTYVVVVICTFGNQKSWNVISTTPKLTKHVTAEISAHVQKLGFDTTKFNTVDYSSCHTN